MKFRNKLKGKAKYTKIVGMDNMGNLYTYRIIGNPRRLGIRTSITAM